MAADRRKKTVFERLALAYATPGKGVLLSPDDVRELYVELRRLRLQEGHDGR